MWLNIFQMSAFNVLNEFGRLRWNERTADAMTPISTKANSANTETVRILRREGKHDEACLLAAELAASSPQDSELQYEAASVHDYLGKEAEAIPFYTAAIAGDLKPEAQRGAYLVLGSTYRTLGRYSEAKATLVEGLVRFPDAKELKVFLAMVLHNLGESKQAIESLLLILVETTNDVKIQSYRRAIELYAQDIERSWTE